MSEWHRNMFGIPYERTEEEKAVYRNVVEYMAKTELFDRTLPHVPSRHDNTEAWITEPWARSQSNSYARKLWEEKCFYSRSMVMDILKRHDGRSAQWWIDEWEKVKKEGD